MNFIPNENYKEVSLAEGLGLLEQNKASQLFSDGLEPDEYIYFDPNEGFRYEDGCIIGRTLNDTVRTLVGLKWCLDHKFYVYDKK